MIKSAKLAESNTKSTSAFLNTKALNIIEYNKNMYFVTINSKESLMK